eukprot:6045088-Pleurochrysis_carterae.AAC.1
MCVRRARVRAGACYVRGGGGGCTKASARAAVRASTRGRGHECLRVMCADASARGRALGREIARGRTSGSRPRHRARGSARGRGRACARG